MTSRPANAGKTAIVTGGNGGLGYQAAKSMLTAGDGWHVVIAGRDEERAAGAVGRLSNETGNRSVEAMRLDLASLASVRSFAEAFVSRGEDLPPLKALVCNAGLQVVSGTAYTEDGLETTFGVNHLGHFLLVNLLLREMVAPARVVFVSSGTHDPRQRTGMPAPRYRGGLALARPDLRPDPDERDEGVGRVGRRRYTTSKLCNIYATYELARRLQDFDPRITANAFDPGAMAGTGLTRDWPPVARRIIDALAPPLVPLARALGLHFSTAEASGCDLAALATDARFEGVTGKYFAGLEETRSSELSYDRDNQRELWKTSAELVGLGAEGTVPQAGDRMPKA